MGAENWDDPHDIIPDEFREEYADCETVADALDRAAAKPSSTPIGERPRCPECGSLSKAWRKVNSVDRRPSREPGEYRCHACQAHFDEPEYSTMIPKNHTQARGFDWIKLDDLADPDERTELQPPLTELDEETRTAVAILLHRPWSDDDGATYREIAPYFPNSHYWVGCRVRAWRDGEYRDLVPDPTVSQKNGEPAERRPGRCHRIPDGADEAA